MNRMILNIRKMMIMSIRVMTMRRVNLKMKEGRAAWIKRKLCAEAIFGFQLIGFDV